MTLEGLYIIYDIILREMKNDSKRNYCIITSGFGDNLKLYQVLTYYSDFNQVVEHLNQIKKKMLIHDFPLKEIEDKSGVQLVHSSGEFNHFIDIFPLSKEEDQYIKNIF